MNDRLEDILNGQSGHWALLDRLMKVAAIDLIVVVGLVLLALWFWPAPRRERATNQRLALTAALSAAVALAIGALVGQLHPEARPFVVDPSARLLIAHAADNGLPSDHALVSFGVAGALIWWRRTLGLVTMAMGFVIGIARIYVGVHWPSDILAGLAVGLLTGALTARTVSWWSGPQRWLSRFLPPQLLDRP